MNNIPNKDLLCESLLKAIKPRLKSPASAILCSADELVISKNDKGYTVYGYVSSQNSYGAMLKNDFTATVSFANNSWIVINIEVGKKTAINTAKIFTANYIAISIFVAIMGLIGYAIISSIIK